VLHRPGVGQTAVGGGARSTVSRARASYAGFLAASNQLVTYPMGGNWYIINYYVPIIGVIHVMIFARLVKG
jgi:hypothetical protein